MQHYVPLHPQIIDAIRPLLEVKSDEERFFEYNSLVMWIKREKIPLMRMASHFTLGDLRKFAEQYGDIIQWDQSNRAYIMTHGVSGVEWKHYKHPLPENVYDVYMKHWKGIISKRLKVRAQNRTTRKTILTITSLIFLTEFYYLALLAFAYDPCFPGICSAVSVDYSRLLICHCKKRCSRSELDSGLYISATVT